MKCPGWDLRAPDSSAVDISGLVAGCVLAPTREREELRFFGIGPTDRVDRAALESIRKQGLFCLSFQVPFAVNEEMRI